MILKKVYLKDEFPTLEHDPVLEIMCPSNSKEIDAKRKRDSIIIIPGGGYSICSFREAEPVGLRFLGYDFNVFILNYSCFPKTNFPNPLIEGIAAVAYIRKHAEEFNVKEDSISVLGFSAGGHLAASISCYYNEKQFKEILGDVNLNTKINNCVLCYPVISMDEDVTHIGTMNNITSSNKDFLKDYLSIEKHVTSSFPRTFLFNEMGDTCVKHKNCEVLISALKENGIEYETDFYNFDKHGCSLCDRSVYDNSVSLDAVEIAKEWPLKAIEFIRRK